MYILSLGRNHVFWLCSDPNKALISLIDRSAWIWIAVLSEQRRRFRFSSKVLFSASSITCSSRTSMSKVLFGFMLTHSSLTLRLCRNARDFFTSCTGHNKLRHWYTCALYQHFSSLFTSNKVYVNLTPILKTDTLADDRAAQDYLGYKHFWSPPAWNGDCLPENKC